MSPGQCLHMVPLFRLLNKGICFAPGIERSRMAYCKVHFIALRGGQSLCHSLSIGHCGEAQTPTIDSIICTPCKEALKVRKMVPEMRAALNEVLVFPAVHRLAKTLDYNWDRVTEVEFTKLQRIFILKISELFQDLMASYIREAEAEAAAWAARVPPVQPTEPPPPHLLPLVHCTTPVAFNDMTAESIMQLVTGEGGMHIDHCLELYNQLGDHIFNNNNPNWASG